MPRALLPESTSLRREATQAKRSTLKVPMSLKDLEATGKLVVLSGSLLHELREYYKKVREHLPEDFTTFTMSGEEARINPLPIYEAQHFSRSSLAQ